MTTLKDLSKHLGLSVTQVSRALNDHWDVSQDTKERVRQAAEALNYRPNLSARKLVTGKAGTVGFVQNGMPPAEESWLYMQIVGHLSREFSRLGRQFLFHLAEDSDEVLNTYDALVRGNTVDGFVLINPADSDPRIDFLTRKSVPFVCHGRALDRTDYPYFDIDNRALGYDLTACLLRHGHRRIGFIDGRKGLAFTTRRHAGYVAAHRDFGLEALPDHYANGQMTEGLGLAHAIRMLTATSDRPSAFVASNTRIAMGVFKACASLGLRVPDDISIVAHDDHLDEIRSEHLPCPLTVTDSPLSDSWEPMARFLTEAIDGAALSKTQELRTLKIIERSSVRTLG